MKTRNAFFIASLLTASIQSAFALDAPEPFEPNDGEVFDLNTDANFSWNKVTGATKYQLVFATDENFSSFDEKKSKCTSKTTCATFTVNKISYKLAKTHAFMKNEGAYFWEIRAYQGRTKSAFSDSYQFYVGKPVEETPVVTTPTSTKGDVETFVSGSKTFSYTKIANDGSELPKTAKLGTGAKDWACTKDNNTGLIWEVKTDDGGLRDWRNTYTNYTEDYPECVDIMGITGFCTMSGFTGKFGDDSNADTFVQKVNEQRLCGVTNWRLPKSDELHNLIYCSDGKYSKVDSDGGFICKTNEGIFELNKIKTNSPTIIGSYFLNTSYFVNSSHESYWTSSSDVSGVNARQRVDFAIGYTFFSHKFTSHAVRLVGRK